MTIPTACPKCRHSESWSTWIGERGEPMGKCHRATCGHLRGFGAVAGLLYPATRKKEPKIYTRPTATLTTKQEEFIEAKFGIPAREIDGYSREDDRFILGVYGPNGFNKRGVVAYSFNQAPKTLTYNEKPEEPFTHYCSYIFQPDHIVVVEDWFSAEKVATAQGSAAFALLGTNLTQEMVTEIAATANKYGAKTWLAFDRDAYPKQLKYLFKYRSQFAYGLYAWYLNQDLKYETTARIEAALDGANNFGTSNNFSTAQEQGVL